MRKIPDNLDGRDDPESDPAPGTEIVLTPADELLLPALFAPNAKAAERVVDFFTTQIHNDNTRGAYLNALRRFTGWCEAHGMHELSQVRPFHIAAFIRNLQHKDYQPKPLSAPTVKQQLAALRMLFDWLVTGHIIEINPAHAVRGPKYVVKTGKTPVLAGDEARALLDSIDTRKLIGLRDRALIAVMTYTFARVSAALQMKVRDYFVQGRRSWVALHEKGGKEHQVPCHHNLEKYLDEYLAAAGIAGELDSPLFRSAPGKSGMRLTRKPMARLASLRMIRRRAQAAGIKTPRIGNHSLRATGITAYLKNKGLLEHAQTLANHASPRTTKLYDRRQDEISLDEVEKISI
jgi:site-specific recombinase XerD